MFNWDWDLNLGRKELGICLRVSIVRGIGPLAPCAMYHVQLFFHKIKL